MLIYLGENYTLHYGNDMELVDDNLIHWVGEEFTMDEIDDFYDKGMLLIDPDGNVMEHEDLVY